MVVKPSAAAEVRQLIAALSSDDDVRREAAIARLSVIGPRAIERLLQEFAIVTSARTRAAMLRVFEALGDGRALRAARGALDDPEVETATAAVALLRAFLSNSDDAAARDALDALVAVAVDRERPVPVRLAAVEALQDLPEPAADAVRRTLADDPDPLVRGRALPPPAAAPEDVWERAIAGHVPESASALRAAVATRAAASHLIALQHLVDAIRARERVEPDAERREEWRTVRGLLHQTLAARGSRIALYDLRDSLEDTGRLPVSFIAALEDVGDVACLEPLAAAYAASSRSADTWWREHLASAFRAIVHREGLTRRHAAIKRVAARWPEAAEDLVPQR